MRIGFLWCKGLVCILGFFLFGPISVQAKSCPNPEISGVLLKKQWEPPNLRLVYDETVNGQCSSPVAPVVTKTASWQEAEPGDGILVTVDGSGTIHSITVLQENQIPAAALRGAAKLEMR